MKKSGIRRIIADLRISIPKEVENELLELYGSYVADDEGREFQYTEQDICEQLRKRLRPYEKASKASCNQFLADALSLAPERQAKQGGGLPC